MDILDLRDTIIPKSDQLNADQLLAGPMTVRVTGVRRTAGEQPLTISYEGDGGRPFKPCKTMRKVLIHPEGWGEDGNKWVGRSMRLYTDPSVKWGGDEVGGVRISHLSDIARDLKVSLAVTKGKKALYVIKRMDEGDQPFVDAIKAAKTVETLKEAFKKAYRAANKNPDREATFKAEYDRRMAELAPSTLLTEYVTKLNDAPNVDEATILLDQARTELNASEQAELNKAFAAKFGG